MRQLLRELAACALLLATCPTLAAAQPGSIQITAASHSVHGSAERTTGQPGLEPDLGVSWLRPGTRFGVLQIEIRAVTRAGQPHLGRTFVTLRDFTHRGVKYTFEAGDGFFAPAPGDYQLRNLFTPSLNFAGAALKARSRRLNTSMMAGRATASRNMFGTDTETLDQDLAIVRGSYAATDRLELSARAARIRTRDLKEFRFAIAESDQAGLGAKFILTPAVQLVADASSVRFRRRQSDESETDVSALAGATILLARGWLQVNASRFSPGELPILSQPLADRRTFFGAGEYDLFLGMRVFGGWEAFRANLDAHPSALATPSDGGRAFAGLRIPVGQRSSASLRVEDGARRSRLIGAALSRVSDTGTMSAEWQTARGPVTGFARFAYRDNVESEGQAGSYTQQDLTAVAFTRISKGVQVFGSLSAIQNVTDGGSGHTYWQLGGGTQAQLFSRGLWLRAESLASRNLDLLSQQSVPQYTFNFGLNGEVARNTVVALNLYADRLSNPTNATPDSWLARSSVRVTRSFPTAAPALTSALSADITRHGGTGTVAGIVFSDWNANGLQDPGDRPLENIPIRLAALGNASTSRAGQFAFVNIPIGLHQIGIDLASLPVDFDPPAVPHVQLSLGRGETKQLAFGLVPLGTLTGRVVRDVNDNGIADDGDELMEGAIVAMDGGARSEQVRGGHFRFDAVRTGTHTVELVPESLPDDATVIGSRVVRLSIGPETLAPQATFVVSVRKRPEIRRVFGAEPPVQTRAAPQAPQPPEGSTAPRANVQKRETTPRRETFAVQVAALKSAARGAALIETLKAAGFAAYLVGPTLSDPHAPYKVRVGKYATRAEAEKMLIALEKKRGEKLWIVATVER